MDGEALGDALGAHLRALVFADRDTDEVTELLIAAVVDWAAGRGWRAYRRAASVVPLPYGPQHSVVDVGIARPGAAPVVVEVDHSDRRRTLDKLAAEAAAGRVAVWVRWGAGRLTEAPPPVHTVALPVDSRRGPAGSKVHSSATTRAAPEHSAAPDAFETPALPGADDAG